MAVCCVSGIGWTLYSRIVWRSEEHTTSMWLRRAFEACPQLGILFMLVVFNVVCDAFPDNRWVVMFCVFVPLYLLGHALFGY